MTMQDYEKWYKNLQFFRREFYILNYNDFYSEAKAYKHLYENLRVEARELLRLYIYANLNLAKNQRFLIWDYLNGYVDYDDLPKPKNCDSI